MAPQIIFILLTLLGYAVTVTEHGKMKKVNASTSFHGLAITYILLYWGDFFDVLLK